MCAWLRTIVAVDLRYARAPRPSDRPDRRVEAAQVADPARGSGERVRHAPRWGARGLEAVRGRKWARGGHALCRDADEPRSTSRGADRLRTPRLLRAVRGRRIRPVESPSVGRLADDHHLDLVLPARDLRGLSQVLFDEVSRTGHEHPVRD